MLRLLWDDLFCPKCGWNLKGAKPNRYCTHCDHKEEINELKTEAMDVSQIVAVPIVDQLKKKESPSIRKQLQDVYYEVGAEIEHGEAFYDGEMLKYFFENLDKLKMLGKALYEENQIREEDDDDE